MTRTTASFDFFDTLFARVNPENRGQLREFANFAVGLLDGLEDNTRLLHARIAAEDELYREHPSRDPSLPQIMERLTERLGVSPLLVPRLVGAEEEIELRLLVPVERNWAKLRSLHSAGASVVVLSDTYHSSDFLWRVLRRHGLAELVSLVVASNEHGATKRTGGLFDKLIALSGGSTRHVIHHGDHPWSDVKQAQSRGIRAILLDWAKPHGVEQAFTSDRLPRSSTCAYRALTAVRAERLTSKSPDDLACLPLIQAATALATAYAAWTLERSIAARRTLLVFMERDAGVLHECVLDLLNAWKQQLDTTLISGGRKVFGRTEADGGYDMELRRDYLAQHDCLSDAAAFVDVGWTGSVAASIDDAFQLHPQEALPVHFFLAVTDTCQLPPERSLAFAFDGRADGRRPIPFWFVEAFLKSPTAAAVGLERSGGRVEVRYGSGPDDSSIQRSAEIRRLIRAVNEQSTRYFPGPSMTTAGPEAEAQDAALLWNYVCKRCDWPSRAEARAMAPISHQGNDSAGSFGPLSIRDAFRPVSQIATEWLGGSIATSRRTVRVLFHTRSQARRALSLLTAHSPRSARPKAA